MLREFAFWEGDSTSCSNACLCQTRPGAGERRLELGLEGWGTLEFSVGRWAGKASWRVRGSRTKARGLGRSGCGGEWVLGAGS